MKITIRTVLLTLTLLGGYSIGQAQTAKIDQHGWKLVFVTYKDDKNFTEKTDKEYGEPSVAFFVKDYPYQVGKEYPKLLVMDLSEQIGVDSVSVKTGPAPGLRKTLEEFDCRRELHRTIRWFWTDGTDEDRRKLFEKTQWDEVFPDTPMGAIFKYACRPRTPSKK
jgi:hypothetical protein